MKPELLEDIYLISLQQALCAEQSAFEAMPMMADAVSNDVAAAIKRHIGETKKQIERLHHCLRAFEMKGDRALKAQVVDAVIAEMREQVAQEVDPELATVIITAGARKIEHVEIACYADLVTMANALHFGEHARLLSESLAEERRMEEQLAALAESGTAAAADLAVS